MTPADGQHTFDVASFIEGPGACLASSVRRGALVVSADPPFWESGGSTSASASVSCTYGFFVGYIVPDASSYNDPLHDSTFGLTFLSNKES
jgi:hypothetical protein